MKYINMDGVEVIVDWHKDAWIATFQGIYPEVIKLRGTVGCSELGMHMGITERVGIVAWVKEGYGYVLLDNGQITSGCFTLFSDNTFSLS